MQDDIELENARYKSAKKFTLDGLKTRAKCVKVVDGDTAHFIFRVYGDLWSFRCRFADCDAAEMYGGTEEERKKAKETKEVVKTLIENTMVDLTVGPFDNWGRPIVRVETNGIDLSQFLNEQGHTKEYTGKKEW